MSTYSRILSRITLDARQFNSELRKVEKKANRTAGQLRRVGRELSISITAPLAALSAITFKNFAQLDALTKALESIEVSAESAEQRMKDLREIARQPGLTFQEAVKGDVRLRAVGISAKQSAKILKEFGNAIARSGGAGKELNTVTVQLGQLAAKGKVFAQDLKPIIEAAPAVASALQELYGSVDSESIQKVLAERNLNSVQFVDELLDKLQELPRVQGGFKNALENSADSLFIFTSTIGKTANEIFGLDEKLNNLTFKLEEMANKFAELPVPVQKTIFGVTGIAGAIGPVVFGIGKLLPLLKGFRTSFTAIASIVGKNIFNPYVLAFALLIKYIKPITKFLGDVFGYFKKLYEQSEFFRTSVNAVIISFYTIYRVGKAVFEGLFKIIESLGREFRIVAENIGYNIQQLLTGNFDFRLPEFVAPNAGGLGTVFEDMQDDIFAFSKSLLTQGLPAIEQFGKKTEELFEGSSPGQVDGGDNSLVKSILGDFDTGLLAAQTQFKNTGDSAAFLKDRLSVLNKTVSEFSNNGIVMSEALKQMLVQSLRLETTSTISKLNSQMSDGVVISEKLAKKQEDLLKKGLLNDSTYKLFQLSAKGFNEIAVNAKNLGDNFDAIGAKKSLTESILKKAAELGVVLTNVQKDLLTNGGFSEFFSQANTNIDKFIRKFDQIAPLVQEIGNSISNVFTTVFDNQERRLDLFYEKEKLAIENSSRTKRQKELAIQKLEERTDKRRRAIQRRQAKAAKASAIFAALVNTAQAITKVLGQTGIAGPAIAPIIAAIGAAQVAAIASTPIPALAKGGLAYGPTLSMVGDNRNAAVDPEVISPLSKLKKMIGGNGPVQVYGRLEGSDIYFSSVRGQDSVSRYR